MNAVTAVLATAALVIALAWRWRPAPARVDELVAAAGRSGARGKGAADHVGWHPWRRRAMRTDPADIGEWCGRVSATCRSGATLSAALRSAVPPATADTATGELRLALERGATVVEAIDRCDAGEHLDVALTAMRACATSGAPAAEPLDRAAAALRARAAEAADRTTHSAQARLSAMVMTFLPAAMLLVLVATSGAVRAVALTPVGLASVLGGAALNLAGWRWMRRIIERAAR